MSGTRRQRHKANREAALRVQASIESGNTGSATLAALSTTSQPSTATERARFALIPLQDAPKKKRQRDEPKLPPELRNNIVLQTGKRQKFVQQRGLPPSATPGVSALDAFLNANRPEVHGRAAFPGPSMLVMSPGAPLGGDSDDEYITVTRKLPEQSRHQRRRIRQQTRWRDIVVPSLQNLYLAQKYGGQAQDDANEEMCECAQRTRLSVKLIDWDAVREERLTICNCLPAAEQLLAQGYFPSAPLRPSLAFSIRLLEFISLHSLNVAPNITAWADTLQQYWARRGVVSEHGQAFRKRLSTALTWYQVLDNRAETVVMQTLRFHASTNRKHKTDTDAVSDRPRKRARLDTVHALENAELGDPAPIKEEAPVSAPGAAGRPSPPAAGARMQEDAEADVRRETRSSRRARVEDVEDDDKAPVSAPGAAGQPPPLAAGARTQEDAGADQRRETRSSRRARVEDVADDDGDDRINAHVQSDTGDTGSAQDARPVDDTGREKLERPSEDLRTKCPLCFGGARPKLKHTGAHVIVCLDANFSQKRRKTAAQDEPLGSGGTRFATDGEVSAMEAEVEEKRARPPRRRRRGTSAKLDDAVLDECEESFTAAQEKVTKASKNYYSDTGLMAILCRHDRVLYVVNMTTPGERQHYALTLLRKLMLELPESWNVGVLYDIACQLSRSIEKHGFLEEFADRFVFGVSVFHAYGHQWACQLVFHPRKREGFGLSDGEGCERFWSAIRCLIPGLRVSGFFRRLFVLERQVDAMHASGTWAFGRWLFKRYNDAKGRRDIAATRLNNGAIGAIGRDSLEREWQAQLTAQLTKLPRQSATAGDKALEEIMIALGHVDELRQERKEDRAKMKKVHKMTATEASETMARMEAADADIKRTETTIHRLRAELGARASQKWDALRGDAYLRARVNARRLRMTIRSSLQSHKFEREKLERSYRRHVMQEKEHSQVKDLVHRREKNVAGQVRRFNALVDQMTALVKQGKAPQRKMILPRRLDSRQLFRLDIDDDIWQEDPGLGPQDEGDLPRWQTDENVKNGIVLMLEERRCIEELERLEAETAALSCWWEEERDRMRAFLDDMTESATVRAAVLHRADAHERMLVVWQRDLGKSPLAASLIKSSATSLPDTSVDAPVVEPEPEFLESDDEAFGDDRSSIYSGQSEEEDDPSAELWDEIAAAAESDGEQEDRPRTPTLVDAVAHAVLPVEAASDSEGGVIPPDQDTPPTTPRPAPHGVASDSASESDGNDEQEHDELKTDVPQALDPSIAQMDDDANMARKPARGYTMTRYRSGRFWCAEEDVGRLDSASAWFSGQGLAVFAEEMLTQAQTTTVDVVHPDVLHYIEQWRDAVDKGDTEAAQWAKGGALASLKTTLSPAKAQKWLILAHVPYPQHWTLVEVRWPTRRLHFYDSFSNTSGYAKGVERNTRLLLTLCEEVFGVDLCCKEWNWVREQRRARQTNGYDCGPFVAADLVALLSSDTPSEKLQKDMRAWRRRIARTVRAKEVVEFVEKTRVEKGRAQGDDRVLVISP